MAGLPYHCRFRRRRSGISLVEVVMCTLLVSVVLVGAMNMLAAVVRDRTTTSDAARAQQMAQQLMSEILSTDYHERGAGGLLDGLLNVVGIEIGESSGDRRTFDDVDDYDGWSASPPTSRDGTALANSTGWRHAVAVEFVNPATPSASTALNNGAKRITVTISRGGSALARLVALRTDKYAP